MNISDHEGIRSLLEMLGMDTWPSRDPRFNVAPTQRLDVVVLEEKPVLREMRWGVTMKAKGKKGQPIKRTIPSSRDDKVWSSYTWRYLIPEQRVLIPINGFYEWKRENKKIVSAFHITPANANAMFFAGIYRKPKEEDEMSEVSIITTSANESMSKVHDRMPVILTSLNAAMAWIQENTREELDNLMQPALNDALKFTQVGDYVNKSTNEGEECIKAA